MNTENQINIEIPQTIIDGIMQKLQECKMDLAPYLQQLTSNESLSLSKIGNKTVATINTIQTESNSEFTPDFSAKVEFFKDDTMLSHSQSNSKFSLIFQSSIGYKALKWLFDNRF
jgi:hypothetical protein